MTYQTEFPNFADMPQDIPAAWDDSSWRHDACPSFTLWEDTAQRYERLVLWVDYVNPADREVSGGKRFLLCLISEDGRDEPVNLIMSDDWQETRKAAEFIRANMGDIQTLARYFAALIRAEYTAEELQEVIRRNRANPSKGCATHDFRDSNAYMFGAFAALFFDCPDPSNSDHAGIMNAAWDIARQSGFAL